MKTKANYKGYTIKIKRDWGKYGFYDSTQRRNRKRGVVVTDGFCNVMPGASWFRTVRAACAGIDALIEVGDGQKWYDALRPATPPKHTPTLCW